MYGAGDSSDANFFVTSNVQLYRSYSIRPNPIKTAVPAVLTDVKTTSNFDNLMSNSRAICFKVDAFIALLVLMIPEMRPVALKDYVF